MDKELIGTACVVLLFVLLYIRVPIGIALIGVSVGGITVLTNFKVASSLLQTVPYTFVATWTMSSIPMFLFMGYLCYHAGITTSIFRAARLFLRHAPGGLAIASIFGCAGFAAVTGSSVACAAAMGRIAIPEMMKQRYDAALSTGTLAAAGTIGALIPPSILMIIYGTIAQVSIIKLFAGGIALGLLTALSYVIVIVVRVKLNPALAPAVQDHEREPVGAVLLDTWPLMLLLIAVFGGLFLGFFTPTEAGAVGAFTSMVIAVAKRSLSFKVLRNTIVETLVTTSAIIVITVGASLFTRVIAVSGISGALEALVISWGVDPIMLMFTIALVYLLLGMFLEPIGAMLITLPIFLPLVTLAGYDLIWFGVIVAKFLEVGMITPPVGLNVFVIKNVVGSQVSMTTIFRGIIWFFIADLVLIVACVIWPGLVSWTYN
ncbi:TRAP transporter large permease [Pseudohoeflea coraliihabitans]|uniref:TRAP transporter large permease protein n=1 Tax=Pseudohoeflea coraliihabitans TaxID=2860393 RepID=A0ABS6WLH5_9HYPH|nr:TRAP transporter large permease subunit [Pseudohoeflea sp. DP4N28-3]MBW3095985.1 TRAP transporter large permease subunit [Pseudohoeflea sp. DP4N28-3]